MIQDRILTALTDVEPKRSKIVTRLSSLLNISERSVYHRLEGNTPFTIEELDKIMKEFQIAPVTIFGDENEIKLFTRFPNRQEIIDNMLMGWLSAVNRMKSASSSHIFMISNYLPFSVALDYPDLIKFRLYFILQSYYPEKRFFQDRFELNASCFKNVDRFSTAISRIFYGISSTEIWGPATTIICLKQLDFLLANSAISISDAEKVLQDIKKLVNKINQYAKIGRKERSPDNEMSETSSSYDLYYNDTYHVDEYTVLSSITNQKENTYIFHPIHGVINSPSEMKMINQYSKLLLYTGEKFSGESNKKIQKCFDGINRQVSHLENNMKT